MARINSYLTFNGDCREAMTFYQTCLGGELTLQVIGESPMADRMPPEMKDLILHASLITEGFVLMGSDMAPEIGLVNGNSVSLMLDCSSEDEIKEYYAQLSSGGDATHPLENTFWGALFGGLTDKYGRLWLLNFNKNTHQ